MNFGFTEEQELLREQVRRFLDKKCPLSEVRKIADSKAGFSQDLWNEMAELGWLGITIPENYGGLGMGWVDLIVVLEECGRSLFPS
ncbi:MAG: acyl-CoA dehydrogenase family protein, partial [Pseudomonadales bacterium]|nr:acyl-CoA dehydrogenase family protein [Pseudomonadales bacterium]